MFKVEKIKRPLRFFHEYVHTHVPVHVQMCIHNHTCTYICESMQIQTHKVHTHKSSHVHAQTHTCAHTRAHALTHVCTISLKFFTKVLSSFVGTVFFPLKLQSKFPMTPEILFLFWRPFWSYNSNANLLSSVSLLKTELKDFIVFWRQKLRLGFSLNGALR